MTTPITPEPAAQQPVPDQSAEFVGRAFLRQIVDDFLRVQNRILVLVAPPGTGKTAFVRALERDHAGDARPYIAHYCAEGDGANPDVFCEQLSARLHALLGESFALPTSARRQEVRIATTVTTGSVASGASVSGLSLNIGTAHPREAFRLLVREPLRAYNDAIGVQRDQQPLVILIDALDRAWDWDSGQGSSIVDILSDAQDLPAWVSVVCTARPGPAVQALQARAGVQIVPINPTSPENLADIELYLRERFLAQLDADNQSALGKALHANTRDADSSIDTFVEHVVTASQGNFLFVRRYVDALRDTFDPTRAGDLAAMVQVDHSPASLQAALDTGYAQALQGIQAQLDRNSDDADGDVLWALAISYAPLNVTIINRITTRSESDIEQSLRRITPLLDPNELAAGRYRFFHAGFADFYRRVHLGEKVRELNLRIAQTLSDSDADETVREYTRLYRWNHLRRSLRLTWPSNPAGSHVVPAVPNEQALMISPAEVQRQVPQPSMQAQALRGLASQALAPELADVPGSWTRALDYLQTAERTLRGSRALRRRRQPRYAAAPPNELIELEKTLAAIGDAYVTIGQRMDPYVPTRNRPTGILQFLHVIWDSFARLPLTLFLLIVLIIQGTKELRIPGALQNLGRGQDWTVARQYVLAVSAYRRARAMASARDDGAAVDDISERLARLYALMGAFDAAVAGYSELMARPTALTRQWHQAIWRLELGEVLLSSSRADQAVDMFSSARLMFETQETNVQLARTLGGLARGHYHQASAADRAGDTVTATNLYNSSLAESAQALDTWQRVTALRNADLGQTDPQIGISGVCHQLWEASIDPNLDVEQQLRARAVLDRIAERHFPQRFEHPLLRLFRIGMAILLPFYLIVGLLLAVQLPNHIQVQTTTDLTFTAPELNLVTFPDSIVSGRTATPLRITEANLYSMTSSGVQLEAGNNWISLESLATSTRLRSITNDILYAVVIYYLSYLLVGLGIIFLASPDRFQINRPGRLVLTATTLEWRGKPSENPLVTILRWLPNRIKQLWQGRPGSQQINALAAFSQTKLQTVLLGASTTDTPAQTKPLPLNQINAIISSDLHFFGSMLYDFSYTVVRPKDSQLHREVVLEGRLVYYRELASELRARLCPQPHAGHSASTRHHSFSTEMVRSRVGLIFCATLIYAIVMLVFLRLSPENSRRPIPFIDYSLSSLYVLITPGLLLPLIWWFVFKPLGVFQSRSLIRFPLLVATAIGALITTVVVYNRFSLVSYGLKPDLASPTFAAGVLLAVTWYARPHRRMDSSLTVPVVVLRTILAIAAVFGLLLLLFHLATTVAWYDSVVRGNTSFARAADEQVCASGQCPPLQLAGGYYQQAVTLDPNDGDGYALRGLVSLSTNQLEQAITDFQHAADTSADAEQRATQYSNIATTHMLLARNLTDLEAQAEAYTAAQEHVATALALTDERFVGLDPNCVSLTAPLLPNTPETPPIMRAPLPLTNLTTRQIISQLGDLCINMGMARVSRGKGSLDVIRNPEDAQAWHEIASAVIAFRAVADSNGAPDEYYEALKGTAGGWLQLAQFGSAPADMPNSQTAALLALRTYREISQNLSSTEEPLIAAGTAWSAIQLGAWNVATDDPSMPGLVSATDTSDAAIYPALHGLIKWFDSTQYPASSRIAPSPAYTAAISEAITLYGQAILRSESALARGEAYVSAASERLDHAYTIRSMLYYGLRNSLRGESYQDDDYNDRMQQAIRDMDRAIALATTIGRTPDQMAGLRYWRGRLAMALADTWQQELRGAHDWNELVPLLSQAYDDFSNAIAVDTNDERRKGYETFWVPWSKALLNDASHFALARAALRDGDAETAERELALIDPRTVQKYNKESAAVPDYSFLYAAVRLARGSDLSFANVFVADDSRAYSALASVTQGIADTESDQYILKASADNPFESRPNIYRAALNDLDAIMTTKKLKLAGQERSGVEYARGMIERVLGRVT